MEKTLRMKCNYCGAEQKRNPNFLINDDACLICEKKAVVKKTEEYFKSELFNKFGGEYELVGEFKDMTTRTLIKHIPCGKIYKANLHGLMTDKGQRCPICGLKSRGEEKIENFLNRYNVSYIPQYRLEEFKKAPYDFFLPTYNLLIEFQGIQHFQPVEKFGGKATFKRRLEIDEKKKELAKQNGLNFFEITYLDLNNIDNILIQRLSLGGE